MNKPRLVLLQWPSDLGGADTRLKDLIKLLHKDWDITCVPNDPFRLTEDANVSFLNAYGVKYCLLDQLPQRFEGVAFSCCNFRLFSEKWRVQAVRDRGLKLIWANDMMWNEKDELEAIGKGFVDMIVFTSEFHRSTLLPAINSMNVLQRHAILPNYFDSSSWNKLRRINNSNNITVGKSSRSDWLKYPEDFPLFYERLGEDINFDIIGWSKELAEKYAWHNFDSRWNLRMASSIPVSEWLSNIDIFVYSSNYKFIENQSRSIVESMMCGIPVIAPRKYNFPNMIWDRRCGWLWDDESELKEGIEYLRNPDNRKMLGDRARSWSMDIWCNQEEAIASWNKCIQEVLK
jgi:glycosyltransferase involved in cell wall biosynthesis